MAPSVTRTAIRLADGRELIYFDDKPGIDRSDPDRRDLTVTRTASEIRYDSAFADPARPTRAR